MPTLSPTVTPQHHNPLDDIQNIATLEQHPTSPNMFDQPATTASTNPLLASLSTHHKARTAHLADTSFWLNLHTRLCTDLHDDRKETTSLYAQRSTGEISRAEFKARIMTLTGRSCAAEYELEWLREKMFNAVRRRYEAEAEVERVLLGVEEGIEGEKDALLAACEERKSGIKGDDLEKSIAKYLSLENALTRASQVERLAKLQYQIAETEHSYAEEVERTHWRIWKAERILSLGTKERDMARSTFELAREKMRKADRRLAEADHVKIEAIIARLEAEDALRIEGREGKKLKEAVEGIPGIEVGE